jgi:hypothetical protein
MKARPPIFNRFIHQCYRIACQFRFSPDGIATAIKVLRHMEAEEFQAANDAAKEDPEVWGCWLRATGADQLEAAA